jgi:hypothetical protein
VILTDRGMTDDKLICSDRPLDPSARRQVLRFFHFYAKYKGLLNVWRRRSRVARSGAHSGPPRSSARLTPIPITIAEVARQAINNLFVEVPPSLVLSWKAGGSSCRAGGDINGGG